MLAVGRRSLGPLSSLSLLLTWTGSSYVVWLAYLWGELVERYLLVAEDDQSRRNIAGWDITRMVCHTSGPSLHISLGEGRSSHPRSQDTHSLDVAGQASWVRSHCL